MDKNKKESENPKCSLCDGKGKNPNPNGGKKSTCPHCQGSGEEPEKLLNDDDDIEN